MKSITKKDFLEKGIINKDENNSEYDEYELGLYHISFGEEINFRIQGISSKKDFDKIEIALRAVNNLLNSEIEITDKVKNNIYKDYRHTVENFELGMVDYDGFDCVLKANEAHFKISNPEDAFNSLDLNSIMVEMEFAEKNISHLYYFAPWWDFRTIDIELKDGKSIYIEAW